MQVLLTINDAEIFDLSKMPNIPAILDKAYKRSRQQMINELAHDRAIFLSFDAWYLSMDSEQREHTMKSIKSTLDIDEFVPQQLRNRDLVVEAIKRFRENYTEANSVEETKTEE